MLNEWIALGVPALKEGIHLKEGHAKLLQLSVGSQQLVGWQGVGGDLRLSQHSGNHSGRSWWYVLVWMAGDAIVELKVISSGKQGKLLSPRPGLTPGQTVMESLPNSLP